MRVNIYQVDSEKDINRTKFRDFRHATSYGEIDPSIYKCVFKGFIKGEDLEDVYEALNIYDQDYLGTYQGHSLSMSDIVELEEDIVSSRGATTMKGCYFCDSVGFKNIKFDTDKCEKMDGLRTLMILPHEKPIEARVVDELESWQKAVSRQGEDSMMEVTYPFEDNAVVVGNEEAKLIGMEGNRRFGESIYAGPLFIVNDDGRGGFCDLTDEQIEKYSKMFENPEDISPEEVQNDCGFNIFGF
jgi:hypothetical protein